MNVSQINLQSIVSNIAGVKRVHKEEWPIVANKGGRSYLKEKGVSIWVFDEGKRIE